MIFGITLKHFARLQAQGEQVKSNWWINRLLLKTSTKKLKTKNIEDLSFGDFVDCERFVQEQNVSFKEVENWKLSEFLFWANYYTGQKIVENVK